MTIITYFLTEVGKARFNKSHFIHKQLVDIGPYSNTSEAMLSPCKRELTHAPAATLSEALGWTPNPSVARLIRALGIY